MTRPMPRGDVRMGPRGKLQLVMPEDARPGEADARWTMHIHASIGEGICPHCAERLEPMDTPMGPGGYCAAHGLWHAEHAGTERARWSWWSRD